MMNKADEASTSTSKKQKAVVNGGRNVGGQSNDAERDEWVKFIKSKLDSQTAKTETISISISRVPEEFHQCVDEGYKPRVISIGLYHRGTTNLKQMEKRKWKRLEAILKQNENCVNCVLNDYFIEFKKLEDRAKRFYSGSKRKQIKSKEFMEMLLLDGCFIVDFLSHLSPDGPESRTWMDHQICNDLLLLENQLPFFVLQSIYCLVKNEKEDKGNKKFLNLALGFCGVCANSKGKELKLDLSESRSFEHLLHLYRSFLFFKERNDWRQYSVSPVSTISSAISLEEAGIEFETRNVIDRVMDVGFEDGVMKITPLIIDTFTISQYRNIIAFEKLHPEIEPRFTAFAEFMDRIINKSEDVALLRKKGIIKHALGSDKEVATVFNKLTSGTFVYLSSELEEVYTEAERHCNDRRKYWWAILWRDYFGNPWQSISIVGVVLILSFTFLQTFFTMYSYFRPPFAS